MAIMSAAGDAASWLGDQGSKAVCYSRKADKQAAMQVAAAIPNDQMDQRIAANAARVGGKKGPIGPNGVRQTGADAAQLDADWSLSQ